MKQLQETAKQTSDRSATDAAIQVVQNSHWRWHPVSLCSPTAADM